MRYFLDLFAGIGGFALGAEWAGLSFDAHYFSEVDEYAIRVYSKRFPDAIALGDITKIDGRTLPEGDWIIAGGFPCQDISVAGKGAGLAGERSGLWFEYARLIGELRPRYAIMENVGALTFRGLDAVLGSLSEIGYDAEWQDIRASDVGAPHRRERIWIVAYPMRDTRHEWRPEPAGQLWQARATDGGKYVADPDEIVRDWGRRAWDGWAEPTDGGQALAYPDSGRLEERLQFDGDETRPGLEAPFRDNFDRRDEAMADSTDSRNVRRDGELEPTQGQVREHRGSPQDGCREWWAAEPDVGRVAHGIPSRVDRLKCLGNSIVPQIAQMIFSALGLEA